MGTRTSVYLSDELSQRVKDSGLPLAELIAVGLDTVAEKLASGEWSMKSAGMTLDRGQSGGGHTS